ncbi:MAG: phospho-sugar mutase [Bacilli bacterium]
MNDWLQSKNVSDELKIIMKNYTKDQLNTALNTKVSFGTAGIRGTLGVGYGYINENIINWATIGYSKFLNSKITNPSIVIAYDNRKNSKHFAQICANVLSINNIKVYMFDELKSTPQLSFTIRQLRASGGINITASHNPKYDNGYKLYNAEGGQYLPSDIKVIKKYIEMINSPIDIPIINKANKELIITLNDDSEFINFINSITNSKHKSYEKILISPLHGCGSIIKKINQTIDFKNIYYVNEQLIADENFTTSPNPNPDSIEAYNFAINNNVNKCKFILATDPDSDRIGVYDVSNNYLYSGDEIATLLINYLLQTNQFHKNQEILTSNVSSELPLIIAKNYGINHRITLTGFKWIGQNMNENTFLMGYEESNGYLIHTKTRDKDGISASFKIIEMINHYYNNNSSLKLELNKIYSKYGYYLDRQLSFSINNSDSVNNFINSIDFNTFENIDFIENYDTGFRSFFNKREKLSLPKSKMLKVVFKNKNWFAIRPSGTEPKVKIYIYSNNKNYNVAMTNLDNIEKNILSLLNII